MPAYFNDSQRQATKDAGRLAGLEVLRLVNEPTAAALAYGLDQKSEGTVAVYDFGGGTFDISILKMERGIFEVKATGGDTRLGGDDIDEAVAAWLLASATMPAETVARRDVQALARRAAEEAKCRLSSADATDVAVELADGTRIAKTLTRADFEALIAPIVDRTLVPCRQALADAGLAAGGRRRRRAGRRQHPHPARACEGPRALRARAAVLDRSRSGRGASGPGSRRAFSAAVRRTCCSSTSSRSRSASKRWAAS